MIGLNLGNLLVHLKADTVQYDRQLKKAVTTMRIVSRRIINLGRGMALRIGQAFRRVGSFVTRWVKRIGIALFAIGGLSVKAFASFDDAMIKSLAIMGDVSEGMQKEMRDLAMTLSREGVTSATDLAKSYFFLASAGLTAKQSMAALATVESFAVAGAFEMSLATDLLTDAQSALGLTVNDAAKNMKNMTRVADVLTGANTLANASTLQFSSALTNQAGPAMKAFNVPLEEGVAVLAAFADQGIKGQVAGSMLSRMLRLMTKGFRDHNDAWNKFNINIFDAQGELVPMADIIRQLSNALGSLSTKQKGAALEMLGFQARSQQAILPLLGLGDTIENYTKALEKMGGITKEIQEKQLRSFSSQMKILWNNIKSVGIAIGERLVPGLIKLSNWFIDNQGKIEIWALMFVEHIIFIKDVMWNFVKFLRQDFTGALKFAFSIGIELAVGFGKSLAAIMDDAAKRIARSFTQAFGLQLMKFFAKLGKPSIAAVSPAIAAMKIGFLKLGTEIGDILIKEKEDPFTSTIVEDLKAITKETIRAIESIAKATEGALGADILSAPLKVLRENLAKLREELKALGVESILFEMPFVVELIGAASKTISKELSRAERQIMKWKEKIENRLKESKAAVAETLFGIGLLDPGRIDAVLKAQEDMKKIERSAERHYKRLEKMKKRLLGGVNLFEGMKESVLEMMALVQGGSFDRFQVVRTSLVDPRSPSTTMSDIARQQLMELKRQTQQLREIKDEGIL